LTEVLENAKMKQKSKLPTKLKPTNAKEFFPVVSSQKKDSTSSPSKFHYLNYIVTIPGNADKKRIFLSNYLSDNEDNEEYDSDKALGAIETVKVPEIRHISKSKVPSIDPKVLKTHKHKSVTRVTLHNSHFLNRLKARSFFTRSFPR
jgi:hypothetical protein